jgi:hypothetical protein
LTPNDGVHTEVEELVERICRWNSCCFTCFIHVCLQAKCYSIEHSGSFRLNYFIKR